MQSDDGCWIFLDTLNGEVATWDVWEAECDRYDSVKEFFADARQDFEKIRLFPIPTKVACLVGDDCDGFKDWIRSFGWPPAREDGATWRRDECFELIEGKADQLR
jgi:hypothetical protein